MGTFNKDMSRIGKQFIDVPKQVKITFNKRKILVNGPKGSLSSILPPIIGCVLDQEKGKLFIKRIQRTEIAQVFHGLTRTLVANMITGVSEGFSKYLKIIGVGYR